ncbi:glycosyltransferase [Candidatus Pelagibacter sp.]|jgi:N-acetylglucosaminyl-diphospho-decaprenol L-rhamnosyltransferase|nr:glycosyltransferase [Candidatus Pelagibacter sp.]|tara:strand:+ start:50 stop:895 length:846 start_codon:yes stop_codon:yes gene_type:complete
MNKDVTIIFVTFHAEQKLIKYLKQFKKNYKIIIIENSANYKLKNKIKKFSNAKIIINKKNTGFGSGANLGLSKVKTKYALHLDLDTSFSNKSINRLIVKANAIDDFAIIGPRIKKFKYIDEHFIKKNMSKNINQMNFIDGCCLLFNMRQMKKIGFFDSNFFLYFEETDLMKRCVDSFKNILMLSDIKIYHKGRSSSDSKFYTAIEENRNWHFMWSKFYFFKKHYGYSYAFIKIFRQTFSSLIKYLFFAMTSNLIKKTKYKARFGGCVNSLFLRSSWFRLKI